MTPLQTLPEEVFVFIANMTGKSHNFISQITPAIHPTPFHDKYWSLPKRHKFVYATFICIFLYCCFFHVYASDDDSSSIHSTCTTNVLQQSSLYGNEGTIYENEPTMYNSDSNLLPRRKRNFKQSTRGGWTFDLSSIIFLNLVIWSPPLFKSFSFIKACILSLGATKNCWIKQ